MTFGERAAELAGVATSLLGWRPEVPLDRALADMLDWWQSARGAHATGGPPGESP